MTREIGDEALQKVANASRAAIHALIQAVFQAEGARQGLRDGEALNASFLIGGAVAAVVEFLVNSGLSDQEIMETVTTYASEALPQLRFAAIADAAGVTQEGTA